MATRAGMTAARVSKGLSINRLAKLAGITRTYCSLIENGHYEPSWEVWCNLAKALGCEVSTLKQ